MKIRKRTFHAIGATILGLALAGSIVIPSMASAKASGIPGGSLTVSAVVTADTTYTVQSGDTLSQISAKFGMTWQELYCENSKVIGTDPNLIYVGEVLHISKDKSCESSGTVTNASNTEYVNVAGDSQHIAWQLLASFGSDRPVQYACLNDIIMGESSWNVHAENPYSYAYGIPQALPGGKMAGPWGTDWENSAYVQLYWMIKEYIPQVYGTPCNAWGFHLSHGWY